MKTSGKISTNRLAVVGTAIVCVLAILASLLPIQLGISTDGMLSISLRQVSSQGEPPLGEVTSLRTQNSKTYYLGNGQYQLSTSLGAVHYLDNSAGWQDINVDYSEADTGNYTARFTKLPYVVRMGDDSTRRIYPDRNDLSYWIELSKPFPSMGTPTKVGGYWVWNFAHALIAVKVRPQAVKFAFRLKDNLAPNSITIPFSSQGITRNGTEILHNGEVIGNLQKPTAIDANNVSRDCDVAFGVGTITISLNTTGLVFPIDVDPTFTVGASSDDCLVYYSGSAWTLASLTTTYVGAGYSLATVQKIGGGMRWTSVTIPQGATINSAYLTGVCDSSYSNTIVNTRITGDDEDDAATWSTLANYQARRGTVVGGANNDYITSAQVAWDGIPAWTAGTSYDSPSLVSVIQEIVNRVGWASGNALALWWDDHDARGTQSSTVYRRLASWDHATYDPPKLTVTYTSVVAPTVTTQAATSIWCTNFTANGNITGTGGENCHTRGFCYMVGDSGDPTTANSTVYDNGAGSYGTGTYTKSITGLTESTYYRVRAYAINSVGTGYGSTVQVTTLPGNPLALTDTAHGGTSVDLSWTKGTGADKTLIRYRTDQYPTGTSDGTQAYFDTASTTSVGSLSYGQIYYFRAWAYNSTTTLYSAGTSDRSCYTDPNAPTSFVVTETTCNSIALSWVLGTGADKTRVQYRDDQYPTTYTDGTQAYFDTGTSVNVTSLDSGQIYYFRAWSYDTESGYYDSYAQLTETTVGLPTTITQDASNVACTTGRINGKISDDGGEPCEARFRHRPTFLSGFTNDVLIDGACSDVLEVLSNRAGIFWTSPSTGYLFYLQTNLHLLYRKTTNGGETWGNSIQISGAVEATYGFDCWADWQTPGDSGTKIHIAYLDTDEGLIRYTYLDTSSDSLGSLILLTGYGELTFHSQLTREHWSCSITKGRGGKLAFAYRVTSVNETQLAGFYTSTDGTTWTSKTSPFEDAEDYIELYCGNETDNNDIWAAFWDRSVDEISLKTYDDSGNTWSEQSISTGMADSGSYRQMEGQVRISDGHLIFAAWDAVAFSVTGNLKVWDINGSGSIVSKTNVLTTASQYFLVSVFINQTNDDIYVAYIGGTGILNLVAAFAKKSTDGGTTWGSQLTVQKDAEDDERWISAGCMKSAWGGKFLPIWFNSDLYDLYCNSVFGWVETDWQNTLQINDTYYEDLESLSSSTEYEFQTQAKNCAGESNWTASAYFTTCQITNTPSTNDFGILVLAGTGSTTINYFTITNTGDCTVDITIQGTNLAGGDDTWTLSGTATPGENIYGLYAGLDDADDNFDVVVNATANAFVSDLAEDAAQGWGLKIYMPTSLSGYDAQQMAGTITLIASAA